MTLKAFVKERVEKGLPIDIDLFGAYVGRTAEVKKESKMSNVAKKENNLPSAELIEMFESAGEGAVFEAVQLQIPNIDCTKYKPTT